MPDRVVAGRHGAAAARIAAFVGAAVYAGVLAVTKPFTTPANVVTAIGLAAGVAAVIFWMTGGRATRPTDDLAVVKTGAVESGGSGTVVPWWILLAVGAGWELFCYFGAPRSAHPTLSAMYDIATRWDAVKAAIVLAWLGLGWEMLS